MHNHTLENWTHDHVFLGDAHARNERRTWVVVGVTLAMMVLEIVAGTLFGSMALLADGWHMATHAAALGIAAFAYSYARRHVADARFSFGTGKLGELAAFTSAVVLALIALGIGWESVARILAPQPIAYSEAIAVAALGLAVNIGCAFLLKGEHAHHRHGHAHDRAQDHDDDHDDDPDHQHHPASAQDNNVRAAYVHVLADALTSVLAIAALLIAQAFGWLWIDAAVGLLGAALIGIWSVGLMRDAGRVLIDAVPHPNAAAAIRARLEVGGDRVSDLHLWQIGPGHHAAIVTVVTDGPQPASHYKARLAGLPALSHVTVEVETCAPNDGACVRAA